MSMSVADSPYSELLDYKECANRGNELLGRTEIKEERASHDEREDIF